jgi:hypothetical protein
MEARPQFVLACKGSALFELENNFIAFGKIINLISTNRMRLDRENLAVDAETADAIFGAELESSEQCVGVRHAKSAQFLQGIGPLHFADGGGGRGRKFDWLVTEGAAQAKSNHDCRQFIAVIDSCSAVGVEFLCILRHSLLGLERLPKNKISPVGFQRPKISYRRLYVWLIY